MSNDPHLFSAADQAIGQFEQLTRPDDPVASATGAAAAIATPTVVVWVVGALTNTQGGAAIVKSLALAGTLMGGGALRGITVMGIGAVAVGWAVKRIIRRLRRGTPRTPTTRTGEMP